MIASLDTSPRVIIACSSATDRSWTVTLRACAAGSSGIAAFTAPKAASQCQIIALSPATGRSDHPIPFVSSVVEKRDRCARHAFLDYARTSGWQDRVEHSPVRPKASRPTRRNTSACGCWCIQDSSTEINFAFDSCSLAFSVTPMTPRVAAGSAMPQHDEASLFIDQLLDEQKIYGLASERVWPQSLVVTTGDKR